MNIPEQFKFEQNFEDAAVSMLELNGFDAVKARHTDSIESGVVQVMFESGEGIADDAKIVNGKREFLAYRSTLSFLVVSNRLLDNQHTDSVAMIRHLMLNSSETLDCTFYHVHDVQPSISNFDQDTEDNLDFTTLVFNVIFGIRDTTTIGG